MNKGERVLVGIPTRARAPYLCGLLSTLLFQQLEDGFDILIVDTEPDSSPGAVLDHPHVHRLGAALDARGVNLFTLHVPAGGRSEATAVNRILMEAWSRRYGYVFKVDDDHVVPPDALDRLKRSVLSMERSDSPALVSGITPWMHEAWPGAAKASDVAVRPPLESPITRFVMEDSKLEIAVGHFTRFDPGVVGGWSRAQHPTQLASAANFMMRPDVGFLWSDIGESSLYADAIWFMQLAKFGNYRFAFDLGCEVWHVAAPSGGVRRKDGEFMKKDGEDKIRKEQLVSLAREWGFLP